MCNNFQIVKTGLVPFERPEPNPVAKPLAWAISFWANSQSTSSGVPSAFSLFCGFTRMYMWLEPTIHNTTEQYVNVTNHGNVVDREYCIGTRRYGISLRVFKSFNSISHSLAALTRKISSWTREEEIPYLQAIQYYFVHTKKKKPTEFSFQKGNTIPFINGDKQSEWHVRRWLATSNTREKLS